MTRSLITAAVIAVLGLGTVRSLPAQSLHELQQLTDDGDFKQHLRWSPDGKQLLFTRVHRGRMGLWILDVESRAVRRLIDHDEAPDFDGDWSPDASRIVFVFDILSGTDGNLDVHLVEASGADRRPIVSHPALDESPRWSPTDDRLAVVSSRDGNQELYVTDLQAESWRRLTTDPAFDNQPDWSPDGKRLAFASDRDGGFEVYVLDLETAAVQRLTDNGALEAWPVWAPDGRQIAFTSNRDGNYEIYVMSADGSEPRNLTRHTARDHYATWSPDGQRIAFLSDRGGTTEIFVGRLSVHP